MYHGKYIKVINSSVSTCMKAINEFEHFRNGVSNKIIGKYIYLYTTRPEVY